MWQHHCCSPESLTNHPELRAPPRKTTPHCWAWQHLPVPTQQGGCMHNAVAPLTQHSLPPTRPHAPLRACTRQHRQEREEGEKRRERGEGGGKERGEVRGLCQAQTCAQQCFGHNSIIPRSFEANKVAVDSWRGDLRDAAKLAPKYGSCTSEHTHTLFLTTHPDHLPQHPYQHPSSPEGLAASAATTDPWGAQGDRRGRRERGGGGKSCARQGAGQGVHYMLAAVAVPCRDFSGPTVQMLHPAAMCTCWHIDQTSLATLTHIRARHDGKPPCMGVGMG